MRHMWNTLFYLKDDGQEAIAIANSGEDMEPTWRTSAALSLSVPTLVLSPYSAPPSNPRTGEKTMGKEQ